MESGPAWPWRDNSSSAEGRVARARRVPQIPRHRFVSIERATLIALTVFGFVKGRFTTNRPIRSAGQTVLVGGLAAAAAFAIAKLIG